MILFILLVLTSAHWTEQHLTYPINYCQLAAVCIHDHSMVCAAAEDGCSRRTFLDQCDMYEYNCDFGARFRKHSEAQSNLCPGGQQDFGCCRETYKLFCVGSDLNVKNPPPLSDQQPAPCITADTTPGPCIPDVSSAPSVTDAYLEPCLSKKPSITSSTDSFTIYTTEAPTKKPTHKKWKTETDSKMSEPKTTTAASPQVTTSLPCNTFPSVGSYSPEHSFFKWPPHPPNTSPYSGRTRPSTTTPIVSWIIMHQKTPETWTAPPSTSQATLLPTTIFSSQPTIMWPPKSPKISPFFQPTLPSTLLSTQSPITTSTIPWKIWHSDTPKTFPVSTSEEVKSWNTRPAITRPTIPWVIWNSDTPKTLPPPALSLLPISKEILEPATSPSLINWHQPNTAPPRPPSLLPSSWATRSPTTTPTQSWIIFPEKWPTVKHYLQPKVMSTPHKIILWPPETSKTLPNERYKTQTLYLQTLTTKITSALPAYYFDANAVSLPNLGAFSITPVQEFSYKHIQSPEQTHEYVESPEQTHEYFETPEPTPEYDQSPDQTNENGKSPEQINEDNISLEQIHENDKSPENIQDLKSPDQIKESDKSPEQIPDLKSPEHIHEDDKSPGQLYDYAKSPEQIYEDVKSPEQIHEDYKSSEQIDEDDKSPGEIHDYVKSPEQIYEEVKSPEQISEDIKTPEHIYDDIKSPEKIYEYAQSPNQIPELVFTLEPISEYVPSPKPTSEYFASPEPTFEYSQSPVTLPVYSYSPNPQPVYSYSPISQPAYSYSPNPVPLVYSYPTTPQPVYTYKPNSQPTPGPYRPLGMIPQYVQYQDSSDQTQEYYYEHPHYSSGACSSCEIIESLECDICSLRLAKMNTTKKKLLPKYSKSLKKSDGPVVKLQYPDDRKVPILTSGPCCDRPITWVTRKAIRLITTVPAFSKPKNEPAEPRKVEEPSTPTAEASNSPTKIIEETSSPLTEPTELETTTTPKETSTPTKGGDTTIIKIDFSLEDPPTTSTGFTLICCGDGKLPTFTPTLPDYNTVPSDTAKSDYLENDNEINSLEKNKEKCLTYDMPPCDRPTSWLTTVQEETEFIRPEEPTYAEITETSVETTTLPPTASSSIETEPSTVIEPSTSIETSISSEPSTSTEPSTSAEPSTSTELLTSIKPSTFTEPSTSTERITNTEPRTKNTKRVQLKEFENRPKTTTTPSPPETTPPMITTTTDSSATVTEAKTTETSSTKAYSWWYPELPCNNIRCERPVTWITTTKKRRRYYGYRY